MSGIGGITERGKSFLILSERQHITSTLSGIFWYGDRPYYGLLRENSRMCFRNASFNINKRQLFRKAIASYEWSTFERRAGWGYVGAAPLRSCRRLQGTRGARLCWWEMANPRPFSLPSHKLLREVSLAATRGSVLEGPPHLPGGGSATGFCGSSSGLLPAEVSWPTRKGGLGTHGASLYSQGNPLSR